MREGRLTYLFNLYVQGAGTAAEQDELRLLLEDPANKAAIRDVLDQAIARTAEETKISPENASAILHAIFQSENQLRPAHETLQEAEKADPRRDLRAPPGHRSQKAIFRPAWIWAAASALIIVLAGVYFFRTGSGEVPAGVAVSVVSEDVEPGRDGAVLILADGRELVLDSLGSGQIAEQNGSQVILKAGKLSYESGGKTADRLAYNTLTTPKGHQFEVALSDGTKVWLNAASSLTYPTVFKEGIREVTITGEAYFEVSHNPRAPFIVKLDDETRIQVLGTRFNVNAYSNESMVRTTLLEGRVKVISRSGEETLYPGYQAIVGEKITVEQVGDIEQVMAWKNGLFNFNNADLSAILRQFERWYDISVKYEGEVPRFDFEGKLPRSLRLSQVIKVLNQMGMQARLENRTLIISP